MRLVSRVAIPLCLVVLLAGPSLAQQRQQQRQRQGQGFGQGGLSQLLQNESVQKELKVEGDQATKLKDAVGKVTAAHRDEFAKLRDLDQNERRTKTAELTRTVNEETLKAVSDILNTEQLKRLKQIELQQAGERAYSRPEVQKALNLTDEQKEKLKTIAEDTSKQRRELLQGGNAQGNREKLTALTKESNDKVQAVLTDEQKKAWKDLTGETFTIARPRRPQQN